MESKYDIVVGGGGHAAVEAAAAAARLGARTLMVTLDLDRIARMSCNPAIGGIGKGHLVREIDALGGVMALATDANGLQFRMLNTGKGPAVRAPRAQVDKMSYPRWMRRYLETNVPNLDLAQGMVEAVLTDSHGRACGIEIAGGERVEARAVVLAPGTFLEGRIHVGMKSHPGGRWGEPPSVRLAESLRRLGLTTYLLKTGTPARLARESIRWDALEQQYGDEPPPPFSYLTRQAEWRIDRPQISCAITRTNPRTHEIILGALDRSPLYTGKIVGIGPRYCPSIETKLVRFADRDSHQIFLEPESLENNLVYVNGVSTSLPADVQDAFLHTIEGLENVRIVRYGYGIEYVACDPRQLGPTLETRAVPGLFLAGQIDGTTGYEEAAGLGLVAGANAVLSIRGEEPLVFRRDEAYLGVMIDDLITKGAPEPYRLFTSRAEYRLLLRQDNADLRLTPKGRAVGLVDDARWECFERFHDGLERERARLRETRIRPDEIPEGAFESLGVEPPREAVTLERLLARPEVTYAMLREWGFGPAREEEDSTKLHGGQSGRSGQSGPGGPGGRSGQSGPGGQSGQGEQDEQDFVHPVHSVHSVHSSCPERITEQIDVEAKYAGYIERQRRMVERNRSMETFALPRDFDYGAVPSLRREAGQILCERRPATLGQATRLAGVNPADVTALLIHLHATRERPKKGETAVSSVE